MLAAGAQHGPREAERLASLARARLTVILCAETIPWRCHRLPVANTILICGFTAIDIISNRHLGRAALKARSLQRVLPYRSGRLLTSGALGWTPCCRDLRTWESRSALSIVFIRLTNP